MGFTSKQLQAPGTVIAHLLVIMFEILLPGAGISVSYRLQICVAWMSRPLVQGPGHVCFSMLEALRRVSSEINLS